MSESDTNYFVSCPRGASSYLLNELTAIGGLSKLTAHPQGVSFSGGRLDGARVCLHSRLASRVMLELAHFDATDAQALYEGAREVPWEDHMSSLGTFAVHGAGTNANLRHTGFMALKVKDAIVDRLRAKVGRRPDVARENPDIQVVVHVQDDQATLSLDVGGGPLHRRGWRSDGREAPLKETLAALLLVASGWDGTHPLLDPLCGSGTILIEAAEMALHLAPGRRLTFGCERWPTLTRPERKQIIEWRREANARARFRIPPIDGSDKDIYAVAAAKQNVLKAGLTDVIRLKRMEAKQARFSLGDSWVVTNPPYGERLEDADKLPAFYAALGLAWRDIGDGTLAVFCAHPGFRKAFGLKPASQVELFNGSLPARLFIYPVGRNHQRLTSAPELDDGPESAAAEVGAGDDFDDLD